MGPIRKQLLALALLLGLASPAAAQTSYTFPDFANAMQTVKSFNCSSMICPLFVPSDTSGNAAWGTAGAANANVLTVQGIASMVPFLAAQSGSWTMSISGTPAYNLTQIAGVAVSAGAGAVGTGSQRVAVGQDTTTVAGSAPGTAGAPSTQVVSVQGVTNGTAVPVQGTVSNDNCFNNFGTKLTADFSSTTSGGSIVTAASAKKIYICAVAIVTSAPSAVSLIEGTGASVCTGGTPAGVFLNNTTTVANGALFPGSGGIALGNGSGTIAQTATANQNLCVIFDTTNTPRVNVHVSYVQL